MTGRKRGTELVKERWEGGVNEKRLTNRPTNCIREELIKTPDGPAGVSARGDSPSFISFSSKCRRFFPSQSTHIRLSSHFITHYLRTIIFHIWDWIFHSAFSQYNVIQYLSKSILIRPSLNYLRDSHIGLNINGLLIYLIIINKDNQRHFYIFK